MLLARWPWASWQRCLKRPESVRAEAGIGAPEIVAGQVDVLPAERREMGEQFVRHQVPTATNSVEGTAEIDGVPQHDGRCHQGKAAGPVLLGLGSAVVQAPEAVEAYGTGQCIVALALVEFGRCLPPKLRLFKPVQGVKCSFDAPDLPQREGQSVLPG